MLQHDTRTITSSRRARCTPCVSFLELAFDRLQLDWQKHVKIDSKYYRPTEVDLLIGDASKAKRDLGWEAKVRFEELAHMMVDADLAAEQERLEGTRKKG